MLPLSRSGIIFVSNYEHYSHASFSKRESRAPVTGDMSGSQPYEQLPWSGWLTLLQSESADVRLKALEALRSNEIRNTLASENAKLTDALTTLLTDSLLPIRCLAADVLGNLGPHAIGASHKLTELLGKSDREAFSGAKALSRIGSGAAPILFDLMKACNAKVLFWIQQALRWMGPQVFGSVVSVLKKKTDKDRIKVLEVLRQGKATSEMFGMTLISILSDAFRTAQDISERVFIADIIINSDIDIKLLPRKFSKEIVEVALKCLHTEEEAYLVWAGLTLRKLPTQAIKAIPILKDLVNNRTVKCRVETRVILKSALDRISGLQSS